MCQEAFNVTDNCDLKYYQSLWYTRQQSLQIASATENKLLACERSVATVQQELVETQERLKFTQQELQIATASQPPTIPLSRSRELLFHSLVQAKLAQSSTGLIHAQGQRGRPLTLAKVATAEKPSDQASRSSQKQRSHTIKTVAQLISNVGDSNCGAVAQQTDVIQRDRSVFLAAAKNAGLSIITRFQPQHMAAICHEIPLSTLAVIKRLFRKTFGCDLFLSLAAT